MYNQSMPNLEEIIVDIESRCSFSFSRSSGPGGQNVNKLNTNVLLRMPLKGFNSLSARQQKLLRKRLANRLNQNDEFFVQVQQERSQLKNRRLAVIRMAELILNHIHEVKPRRKTQPSKASKERRLNEKKRHSNIKKNRGRPSDIG